MKNVTNSDIDFRDELHAYWFKSHIMLFKVGCKTHCSSCLVKTVCEYKLFRKIRRHFVFNKTVY